MKGVYILLIEISRQVNIKIGKLGIINFPKATYAYIGSSQNNLEKRVNRHLLKSKHKKFHWHIDYLLDNKYAKVIDVKYKKANKKQECITAKKLLKNGLPIKYFGCSDCKCISHLIKLQNPHQC